jgi:hypothetical protein
MEKKAQIQRQKLTLMIFCEFMIQSCQISDFHNNTA